MFGGKSMHIELTNLLGLDLYTTKGVYVGRVQDVVIESSEGVIVSLAVVNVNKKLFNVGNKGILIPYRWITAVGDIALMMHPMKASSSEEKVPEFRAGE
jgi:sporulation protein YlmC with PRC-barrel domain